MGTYLKILAVILFLSVGNEVLAFSNSIESTPENLIIHSCIKIWNRDSRISATEHQTIVAKWQTSANQFWNSQTFDVNGKTVRIDFRLFAGEEKDPTGCHSIELYHGAPDSSGEYSAYIATNSDPHGPHSGGMPIQLPEHTLVHELGHILNLDDEYIGLAANEDPPPFLLANNFNLQVTDSVTIGEYKNVSYGLQKDMKGIMSYRGTSLYQYYILTMIQKLK